MQDGVSTPFAYERTSGFSTEEVNREKWSANIITRVRCWNPIIEYEPKMSNILCLDLLSSRTAYIWYGMDLLFDLQLSSGGLCLFLPTWKTQNRGQKRRSCPSQKL